MLRGIAAVVVLLSAVGCTGGSDDASPPPSTSVPPPPGRAVDAAAPSLADLPSTDVFSHLALADGGRTVRGILHLLPNTFRVEQGRPDRREPFLPGALLVEGTVERAVPRRTFGRPTLHLTVEVTDPLGSDASDRLTAVLPLSDAANVRTVARGLEALGPIVLPLTTGPGSLAHDPPAYVVVADGALLVTVDTSGDLAVPALLPEEEALFLRRSPNIHALRASAYARGRVLTVLTRPTHVEIVRERPL